MICRGCNKEKDISEFPLRKDRGNKPRPYCVECSNDIVRVRYNFHKENAPFKLKTTRAKSRSQYLKVPFNLDAEYLESIWTGICPITGHKLEHSTDRGEEFAAELDRFYPAQGYVKGNVAFISRKMNRIKNNVSVKEIEQLYNWMKEYESRLNTK